MLNNRTVIKSTEQNKMFETQHCLLFDAKQYSKQFNNVTAMLIIGTSLAYTLSLTSLCTQIHNDVKLEPLLILVFPNKTLYTSTNQR